MNKKYTKYNYTNGKKHTVEMDTNEKKYANQNYPNKKYANDKK